MKSKNKSYTIFVTNPVKACLDKQARRLFSILPLFLSLIFLLCSAFPVTALAHDAEYSMWNGEQNVLIIGTIDEIDGNLCHITVSHKLTCGPEEAKKYNRPQVAGQCDSTEADRS